MFKIEQNWSFCTLHNLPPSIQLSSGLCGAWPLGTDSLSLSLCVLCKSWKHVRKRRLDLLAISPFFLSMKVGLLRFYLVHMPSWLPILYPTPILSITRWSWQGIETDRNQTIPSVFPFIWFQCSVAIVISLTRKFFFFLFLSMRQFLS